MCRKWIFPAWLVIALGAVNSALALGPATDPYPANGAIHSDAWVTLSWRPGESAVSHEVYFGTNYDAVAHVDTADTTGIYRGRADANSYVPPEVPLEWGRTYYWRIDAVNDADPDSPWKGDVWSFSTIAMSDSEAQLAALRVLEEESQSLPYIRFENGIPRFVSVEVPLPGTIRNDPVIRALYFLKRYKDMYRLDDPRTQLFLHRVATDQDIGQHVFFGQQQDGIPVFGAELAVHIDEDSVLDIYGGYLPGILSYPPPALSARQAETIAIGATPGADTAPLGVTRLMYFNNGLISGQADETHLAWRVMVHGLRSSDGVGTSWMVFVDSQDGEVLSALDQSRSYKNRAVFTLGGSTPTVCWYGSTGGIVYVQWYDENGKTADYPAGVDKDGDDAFKFAGQIYDFFNKLGRDSWDDNGAQIKAMVHAGGLDGPQWNPSCSQFEFVDGSVLLYVFAHEFTHAIISSFYFSLLGSDQPGALEESYGDVFGALVDSGNWSNPTRDLANPPAVPYPPYGDLIFFPPDHMTDFLKPEDLWVEEDISPSSGGNNDGVWDKDLGEPGKILDDGGIHINCGIPSKAAYLIAEGGTHNGITVKGITRPLTSRLYYEVMITLAQNAQFMDARDKTVTMARDFADKLLHGFAAVDVCSVINAFASVGLGPMDNDCDGKEDVTGSDQDGDYVPDSKDNCPTVANPGQEDHDQDGKGDACDPDDDEDGVLDNQDNCPFEFNQDQWDKDGDAIGEVCDDNDGDGVVNAQDNCPTVWNKYQEDNDKDGQGDVCDSDDDNDGILDFPAWGMKKDNCPFVWNKDQKDSDGDDVGDACDNCPGVANPDQTNTDKEKEGMPWKYPPGDDLGDACDPDDDNDGIPDGQDNCPKEYNPPNEILVKIEGVPIELSCLPTLELGAHVEGFLRFLEPEDVIHIPISPCLDVNSPSWLPEYYDTVVKVSLPCVMPARIVDDKGFAVSKSSGSCGEKVFHFKPSPDYFYQPPAEELISGDLLPGQPTTPPSSHDSAYRGTQYFLVIFPPPDVEPGQEYPITIEIMADTDGDRIGDTCECKVTNIDRIGPVSFEDAAMLGDTRLLSDPSLTGDVNKDGIVSILDIMQVAEHWLSDCSLP